MGIREMFHHPQAAPERQAAQTASTACYVATSPAGPLLLQIDTSVRHAADAAIALQRCDDLLCALDDWTDLHHDWRWTDRSPRRPAAGSHAMARWHIDDSLAGRIELPWALLRGLPRPPASLAASLQWPALPAVLAVSQIRLTVEELRQLEPGGAVVLPESLSPPWRGRLRAADEPAQPGFGVPVDLTSPSTPRLAQSFAHSAELQEADMRIACEVRLGVVHALAADRMGGWCDGETLNEIGATAALWRCAGVRPARLATGRLMPWGTGWALALESLDDAEPDATLTH